MEPVPKDANQDSDAPLQPDAASDDATSGTDDATDGAAPSMDAAEDSIRTVDQSDVDALLQASEGASQRDSTTGEAQGSESSPFQMPDLPDGAVPQIDPKRVTMLNDVNLRVRIELGRTKMLVEDVLKLDKGSVVELDKLAGDPVDVFVNDRLIARGEVLVLNDNFCVRINEVLSHDPHRVSA